MYMYANFMYMDMHVDTDNSIIHMYMYISEQVYTALTFSGSRVSLLYTFLKCPPL